MSPIQFGWSMPAGNGTMTRDAYLDAKLHCLDSIAGHFDSAWLPDHMQFGANDFLEGWTALTYLAALRPELKFGHIVLCQTFRNPALLAKMAATFQYMSRGRFIFGVGAGWNKEEHDAYGYTFPTPGVRVDELDEALQIVKALWQEDNVSFSGKYHQISHAYCVPKPDPLPIIMVAGSKPRMMALTARHANWWNVTGTDIHKVRTRIEACEQACIDIGRDPATLRCTLQASCLCAPTEKEVQSLSAGVDSSNGFVGTPEQVIEQMRPFIDLGISYFMLSCHGFPAPTTLETLAHSVLPMLNAGQQDEPHA